MNGTLPAPSPSVGPRPSPWRWWVCVMLLLASTLNYMDRLTLNQTAVKIKAAFGIDNLQYSLLESTFVVAFSLGTLTMGWVVDRVGVRVVYPLAVLGWSFFGFLTGFAPTFWMLLACRFGLGLFEAGNWPCGIRTTRQVMPPAERSLGNSLFQSGTALGAVVTPFIVLWSIRWVDPEEPIRVATAALTGAGGLANDFAANVGSWRVPFIVIGLIGLIWVVLWVTTVPRRVLNPDSTDNGETSTPTPFSAVFFDRRFWILIVVIIGVNTSWHTFRVWMPLFLQEQQGYSFAAMSRFMTWYYVSAELGGWTVGLATLLLARRGVGLHTSRVLTFAVCTVLVLAAAAVPFLPDGPLLRAILLAFGFGAFGLFPTYFTLSQELFAQHQGKVTGTLGFINGLYLALVFPLEGVLIKSFGSYSPVLAASGVLALVALSLIVLFWREPAKPAVSET